MIKETTVICSEITLIFGSEVTRKKEQKKLKGKKSYWQISENVSREEQKKVKKNTLVAHDFVHR